MDSKLLTVQLSLRALQIVETKLGASTALVIPAKISNFYFERI